MAQLQYWVEINFKDFDNSASSKEYKLFASSEDTAKNIAKEMFFIDFGVLNDMTINAHLVEPNVDEKTLVNEKLIRDFSTLKEYFNGMSYREFIHGIDSLNGYSIHFTKEYASFMFHLLDFTCRLIFKDGQTYIDEDNLLVKVKNGRTYFVTNKLSEIYITPIQ